jgi:hypothetical protein
MIPIKAIALIVSVFFALASLGAQKQAPILPEGAYLLPYDFHPGDLVELKLPIQAAASNGKRELRLPDGSQDYEIKRILLESSPKGSTLTLFFIPWIPGEIKIVPFETEGARFPGATVYARSLLSGDDEKPRPPRGLLFLPGTKTLIAVIASSLAALALAVWAAAAFLMPFLSRLLSVRRARKPFRRFQHELRIMRKRLKDEDQAYFYALLSRAFRAYASARLFPAFASLTAGEFGTALAVKTRGMPARLEALGEDREFVARVLMRSDMVRFADSLYLRTERVEDMERLSRIVENLEAQRAGA